MAQGVPDTSNAALITEFNEPLEIREIPVPDRLEEGAILVRIQASSICGSDIHIWDGSLAASMPINLPVIPGHEMVGEIVRIGEGSSRDSAGTPLEIGDRIVFSHASCGQCHYCTVTGQGTLCNDRQWYMFSSCEAFPYLVGGFSEYCYVFPNSGRIRVPDDVTTEVASAASCALRTVVHSFERLGTIEPWQTIVIQGSGPLGLFATALADHSGAGRIVVVGGPEDRLDLARDWGANDVVPIERDQAPAERVTAVKDLVGEAGADIVMEFSGGRTAFSEGLDLLRDGAIYLVTGQVGGHEVSVSPSRITRRNWTLLGSWSGEITHYWKALQFIRNTQHKYDFSRLISGTFHLDEISVAMERMKNFEEIKPIVVPTISGKVADKYARSIVPIR